MMEDSQVVEPVGSQMMEDSQVVEPVGSQMMEDSQVVEPVGSQMMEDSQVVEPEDSQRTLVLGENITEPDKVVAVNGGEDSNHGKMPEKLEADAVAADAGNGSEAAGEIPGKDKPVGDEKPAKRMKMADMSPESQEKEKQRRIQLKRDQSLEWHQKWIKKGVPRNPSHVSDSQAESPAGKAEEAGIAEKKDEAPESYEPCIDPDLMTQASS